MRQLQFVTIVLAVLGMIAGAGNASGEVPIGSITAIAGTVNVTRNGKTTYASYGDAVKVGERIATGPDGHVTITLSDNTQMQVVESSTIVVTEARFSPNGSRASTKINLDGGTIRSLVRYTAGATPNFEVRTPNAIAAAHGTAYDTTYRTGVTRKGYDACRDFTDVTVYNGTVDVSKLSNVATPPVVVHSGEKTIAPCALAVAAAEPVSPTNPEFGPLGLAAIGTAGVIALGGGLAGILTGSGGGSSTGPLSKSVVIPKTPASPFN
jgi:ferric-dicitrate binding protein FerR (iron transport regulator)